MTIWCVGCALVGKNTPATHDVDEDAACAGCAPRMAAAARTVAVPLRPSAAPATPAPAPQASLTAQNVPKALTSPAPAEVPPVKKAHRLSEADKVAIRAAGNDVSNSELARRYGVTDAAIHYRRRGAGARAAARAAAKPAPKKSAPKASSVASELPLKLPALAAILDRLTEDQCDAAWGMLSLADKTAALRGLLVQPREET